MHVQVESITRLAPEDIERMLREARAQAQSDRREKLQTVAAIRAENLVRAAELLGEKAGESVARGLAREELALVQQMVFQLKTALANGNYKAIQATSRKLEKILYRLDHAVKAARQASDQPVTAQIQ